MAKVVHNVDDRRRRVVGSWKVTPLRYDELSERDIGRTVIYQAFVGRAEAGTLTSWKNGIVFARYSQGDTAAGANHADLSFGLEPLDTADEIMASASNPEGK